MRINLSLVAFGLALLPHALSQGPSSPCPNVLTYEEADDNRWYATIELSTDVTLHGVWVDIMLDEKADILANWFGKVTTQDNTEYRLENKEHKLAPGPSFPLRFYVQHNTSHTVPRIKTIRLNGREICRQNTIPARDKTRPPALTKPPQPVYVQHPETPAPNVRPYQIPNLNELVDRQLNRGTVEAKPSFVSSRPTLMNTVNPQNASPSRPTKKVTRPQNTGDDEYTELSPGTEDDYFQGDFNPTYSNNMKEQSTNRIPLSYNNQCGTVSKSPAPLVVGGQTTISGQWPWHIAIYHAQTVDSKYICGGTLVSVKHVITAAHCVTRKGPGQRLVNQQTLTVYLGKHNLRISSEMVQVKFVETITVHPEYNATNYYHDLAILSFSTSVDLTAHVRPACLWPENSADLEDIVGQLGSVVGWGYDEKGQVTANLLLAKMPVVKQETCLWSNSDFFVRYTSDYTYCAGFLNGTSVCNGDSGGGMVFNLGSEREPRWHLRGLVSLSAARQNEYRCDPTHYVIFTDLAKFQPWLKETMAS